MVLTFFFLHYTKKFTNKYLSLLRPKNSLRVNVQKETCYSKQENPIVSLLTSVSVKHPITAMAFASHAVSKSVADFELHLFSKS